MLPTSCRSGCERRRESRFPSCQKTYRPWRPGPKVRPTATSWCLTMRRSTLRSRPVRNSSPKSSAASATRMETTKGNADACALFTPYRGLPPLVAEEKAHENVAGCRWAMNLSFQRSGLLEPPHPGHQQEAMELPSPHLRGHRGRVASRCRQAALRLGRRE